MPFFLDGNPTQGEISEAINYLLSNFSENVSSDQGTGQIIGPGGEIVGYLYKYIFIKYADSFDGSVGFSNTPTNKGYYGIRNSDSSTESTNPVDYVWTQVTGGFGTTKFLYYLTTGGRQIQFQVSTAIPNPGWSIDPGTAIDLDITSATSSVANFVVIRITNNSAAPTDAECVTAIGRTPIAGDLCTINYNSGISSITYKYTSGWAVFQKYITGDLIVADSIVGNNIAGNTITGNKIAANTITASNIAASTITATQIAANTITADRMSVSQLSAIAANLGSITAGSLNAVSITGSTLTIGSSPAISGTTMTGSGAQVYSDGRFAFGNSSSNVVFNGSSAYLNGFAYNTTALSSGLNVTATPQTVMTFTVGKAVPTVYGISGYAIFSGSGFATVPESTEYYLNIEIFDSGGTSISAANFQVQAYLKVFQGSSSGIPYYAILIPYAFSNAYIFNAGTYTMRLYYSATPSWRTITSAATTPTTTLNQTAFKCFQYQASV